MTGNNQVKLKGNYLGTLKGEALIRVMQVLLNASDYLSSDEIGKLAKVNIATGHINNLRKRYNIRIDVDDSVKNRHRFKIKEGYSLS